MKALEFNGEILKLADVPNPSARGEALIRILLSGICNTDLEIVKGYADFRGIVGHEFVGVVEASDERPDLIGKRVVGEINVGCGQCGLCAEDDPRHCEERTVLGIHGRNGCHAEYVNLPVRNLLPVPDVVPDELAVFTEPLAAAYGVTERVEIGPDTKVAVIGDGKLGILCAWSLARRARHLHLIGKHQSKLNAACTDSVECILVEDASILNRSLDVVVEASGSRDGLRTALDLLRPKGKLVLKSTVHGSVEWEPWRVVVDEISVVGSRCGRFGPALELLKDRSVDVRRLISSEYPLTNGLEAFEEAARPGVLKVLLRP